MQPSQNTPTYSQIFFNNHTYMGFKLVDSSGHQHGFIKPRTHLPMTRYSLSLSNSTTYQLINPKTLKILSFYLNKNGEITDTNSSSKIAALVPGLEGTTRITVDVLTVNELSIYPLGIVP